MSELRIDAAKCVGCRICLKKCPFGAIEMVERKAVCNPDACTLCRSCISACPMDAISLEEAAGATQEISLEDYHGVWVFAEQWNGNLHASAGELLTEAKGLAKTLGEPLTAVVFGKNIHHLGRELLSFGADEVLMCEASELEWLEECRYSAALADLIRERKPAIVLYGATTFGRGMAPMVAASVQTGLTADCTKLEVNPETRLLEQTRPAFGGNVMATIICKDHRPQMATVRPGVFKSSTEDAMALSEAAVEAAIVKVQPKADCFADMPEIVKMEEQTGDLVRLEEAEIIFAGGAGFESKEEFALLEDAAKACGAVVGASRGAVDAGYATHGQQVGQTGTVVSPKLYVAVGISGAIQHVIGMQNSEYIVAINSDPDAPIFQVADIGIVGDAKKAMKYLTTL